MMKLLIYVDGQDMFGNDVFKLVGLKSDWTEKFEENDFVLIEKMNNIEKYYHKDITKRLAKTPNNV